MSMPDHLPGRDPGYDLPLLRAVPASTRRLLEVGCGAGRLGSALKAQDPRRTVFGVERDPARAAEAARRLDQVFPLDVEAEDPPLESGSLDGILYGDVLARLCDPAAVLRRLRRLLAPGGLVLVSVANAQHHAALAALLRGEPPGAGPRHRFTYAEALRLLLDAGFAPQIVADVADPCPEPLRAVLGPVLDRLSLHPGRTRRYLNATRFVLCGTPLDELAGPDAAPDEAEPPLSLVVCVADEATLRANLLRSPCLSGGGPHEVLLYPGCPSAAAGLNRGLEQARHPLVVCAHQDVYLPRGWPGRLLRQYRQAEQAFGPVGVAGVYGVARASGQVVRAGHVVDRDRLLREPPALPAPVETLDELLLVLPRGTPLRFDPQLGFHFYGADVCLQARERGLAAVALDAVCFHHSRSVGLPAAFGPSAARFAAKWARRLPVATSCAVLDAGGGLRLS